ncbi:MAG: molybdenum cofactor guanylyltransferase [Proteobacteria bacterium]|nr:molybdenum cofactor guanylyltransferase [Desulfobacteraceae bacterium]MBU2521085.1 molybdenum cofactor guanylyltransferase [Pseudomonadota bacterium]MBU3980278.1 molybdenum cofactor guanylyltransferase [Pseudomonadota bacterium]MBU4012967.1 molybdenum cofactor guanylyltransferase [Pseudomonadota bacterium]MBU4066959.1 molybdenum cofactor guanylyltransferase [Pseudomonadota bacterium]
MKFPCTGVILAGGQSTRFSGTNKAFISVGGKRILDRIYEIFDSLFDEVILVANDPIKYLEWDLHIVSDILPFRSSLTGIHTGLFFTNNFYTFITACDIPFLKKELVETILENIEAGVDVVIPEILNGMEPLCAVYSKRCLKPVENNLIHKELKIKQFFKKVRVKKLPENVLRERDPDLISFFNINTPDDLARAEAHARSV